MTYIKYLFFLSRNIQWGRTVIQIGYCSSAYRPKLFLQRHISMIYLKSVLDYLISSSYFRVLIGTRVILSQKNLSYLVFLLQSWSSDLLAITQKFWLRNWVVNLFKFSRLHGHRNDHYVFQRMRLRGTCLVKRCKILLKHWLIMMKTFLLKDPVPQSSVRKHQW